MSSFFKSCNGVHKLADCLNPLQEELQLNKLFLRLSCRWLRKAPPPCRLFVLDRKLLFSYVQPTQSERIESKKEVPLYEEDTIWLISRYTTHEHSNGGSAPSNQTH